MIKYLKTTYKRFDRIFISIWKSYNKILFRIKGACFGKNLQVYKKVYLQIREGKLYVGNNFTMTSGGGINPLCRNVRACIYITHNGNINIGDNVGMSSPCVWISNSLTIGNNVKIGGNCIILDNDVHQIDYIERRSNKGKVKSAPIVIEDDVWLGANVMVLKGVTIGARSIIGAGSVVAKDVPADCVAVGNPAQIIKNLK